MVLVEVEQPGQRARDRVGGLMAKPPQMPGVFDEAKNRRLIGQ
jgi:hypothetical protein